MGSASVRNKFLSHAILILLVVSTLPLLTHISSENASAAPDTHTWDGGAWPDPLASTANNWVSDVAPITGDSVVFDGTNNSVCTWDLAITLNAFSMNVGYNGVVTQGANFGVALFSLASGTFTGSTSYILTVSVAFTQTGGSLTFWVLQLTMSGYNGAISSHTSFPIYKLTTNDDTTISGSLPLSVYAGGYTNAVGKTLTIIGLGFTIYESVGSLSNLGMIAGTGTLVLDSSFSTNVGALGSLNCAVLFTDPGSDANHVIYTLTGNCINAKTVAVQSGSATKTVTLDLSASNYALSATDITVGTRGILNGSASTISSSDNIDFSAGQFNANKSLLLMTGAGKTIKTANTNGAPYDFQVSGTISTLSSLNVTNNLTIDAGKSLTMGSGKALTAGNLTIGSTGSLILSDHSYIQNQVVNNGAITQNSKRLNISGSCTTPLTGYGTFDGDLYLNGSTASSYEVQTGLPMGNLYFDRDTKINLDSTRYLQVVPSSAEFVSTSVKSIGTEQGYAARWTATSTGPVTYTLTANANELYDIWVDHTTRIGVVQTSDDGIVQFTYNGPFSTHEFTVSKSSGPPTSLSASFSYSISGNQVSFTDKSYGGVSTYLWDFGDGTGSTNQNPVHKYAKSGDYTISLTVYDSSGHSSTAKTTITLKLGPQFPVEPTPKGWNVWVSDKLTVSVSALALLIFGTWFLLAGYFPPLLPLMTPKTKKILGLIIIAIGLYWFVFVDNSHSWLGWGSV